MSGTGISQRIAFLDEDHVMRLLRSLIAWEDPQDRDYARSFFLPETLGDAELDSLGASLRRVGAVCEYGNQDVLAQLSAILFRRGRVTAGMMDASPNLRLIQRLGESAAGIDLMAAANRGIPVSCLPRLTLAHVAEHVMMLMLALSRKLLPASAAARTVTGTAEPGAVSYNWADITNIVPLAGRTLGIVGLGEIGVLLARRAAAFGMRVIYADREPLDGARERELNVAPRPLGTLLAEADIVSLHVPATPDNCGLIGAAELARMRPEAFLINSSRGSLVDEAALFAALSQGRLAGGGLDVHATEPRRAGDPLLGLANVVLTPHIAGGSRKGVLAEIGMIIANLEAALAGRPVPHGLVTADAVAA